jgi:hypothetical protein
VIMGAGPAHAVHFGTYEAVKELIGGNKDGGAHQWLSARKSVFIYDCPFRGICPWR